MAAKAWSYIPRELFRGTPNDKEGLVGLSYQEGGLPFYEHRYYVNATPARRRRRSFGGSWQSMLVGGLGKGGQTYFALDVTDPLVGASTRPPPRARCCGNTATPRTSATRSDAPIIVKTRAFGGKWVVIVPSGYNNASGLGMIIVLDAANGALLKKMSTGVGNPATPAGLAHVSSYVQDARNQLVEQVYAGDLYGNLWRFDLSDANDGNWTVQKMATLGRNIAADHDRAGDRQSTCSTASTAGCSSAADSCCTSRPAVGTAGPHDVRVRDGTAARPVRSAWRSPRPTSISITDAVGLGAGVIASKGWYDDLPAGYRDDQQPDGDDRRGGLRRDRSRHRSLRDRPAGQGVVSQFGNGASVLEVAGSKCRVDRRPRRRRLDQHRHAPQPGVYRRLRPRVPHRGLDEGNSA